MQEPEDKLISRITGSRTAYNYNGHILSAKKILNLGSEIKDINEAIKRVVPKIEAKLSEMYEMIDSIPEEIKNKQNLPMIICPEAVKEYYKKSLDVRTHYLLIPAYETALNHGKTSITGRSLEENIERAYQQREENKTFYADVRNPMKNNIEDR